MKNVIRYIKQFRGFFIAALLEHLRSPLSLMFGLIFPIIFMFIFGYITNGGLGTIQVGLVTPSDDSVSAYNEFKKSLNESELFEVEESYNGIDFQERLTSGELDAYLLIEKILVYKGPVQDIPPETLESLTLSERIELEEKEEEIYEIKVTTFANANNQEKKEIINQTVNNINLSLTLKENNLEKLIYNTETKYVDARQTSYIDFVLPGIVGFSILSATIFGTSSSFLMYRDKLILKRLFVAPSIVSAFIFGQSIARFIFTLFQNLLIILVAVQFFEYSPVGEIFGLLQMLFVICLAIFTFLGVGYIVAGIARTDDMATSISNLIVFPQFILSGTFFDVDRLPAILAIISKFTPLYNFNQSIRYITVDGLSIYSPEVLTQLGYLTIWMVIIYFFASKTFKVK
jgi:ABC-2 type transport system permease protein